MQDIPENFTKSKSFTKEYPRRKHIHKEEHKHNALPQLLFAFRAPVRCPVGSRCPHGRESTLSNANFVSKVPSGSREVGAQNRKVMSTGSRSKLRLVINPCVAWSPKELQRSRTRNSLGKSSYCLQEVQRKDAKDQDTVFCVPSPATSACIFVIPVLHEKSR